MEETVWETVSSEAKRRRTMFRALQTFPNKERKGAGVVERGTLEKCCAGNRTEGSNPSLSAMIQEDG